MHHIYLSTAPAAIDLISNSALAPQILEIKSDFYAEESRAESNSRSEGRIAILRIAGSLTRDYSYNSISTSYLASVLRSIDADKSFSDIILDINSPGGSTNSISVLLDYLQDKDRRCRVYASVETAASAAYWLAAACDGIYLQNRFTACVGSIGALCVHIDPQGYYRTQGFQYDVMYSNLSPDKNHESREASKENFNPILEELDRISAIFHKSVTSMRKNIKSETLTGLMYHSDQAISMGLADGYATPEQLTQKILLARNLTT